MQKGIFSVHLTASDGNNRSRPNFLEFSDVAKNSTYDDAATPACERSKLAHWLQDEFCRCISFLDLFTAAFHCL